MARGKGVFEGFRVWAVGLLLVAESLVSATDGATLTSSRGARDWSVCLRFSYISAYRGRASRLRPDSPDVQLPRPYSPITQRRNCQKIKIPPKLENRESNKSGENILAECLAPPLHRRAEWAMSPA